MISMLASAALICACSLAVGAAIAAACGWQVSQRPGAGGRAGWSWLSGAIGIATLLIVASAAARLPGHAATAAAAIGVVTVAALVYLVRSGVGWRGPVAGLIPAALAALAASLPFIVNNHVGILGVGLVNDDMSSHLLVADWVQNRTEPIPHLVSGGYPLGPHSLVAALSEVLGADQVNVFAGLTLAIAALGAITAIAVLRQLPTAQRAVASALAALAYLSAAYLVQGAFKEPLQALLVIGFALGLRELTREEASSEGSWQLGVRALPLAVIAAGSVFNYSFPGLAWLAGTAVGAWILLGAPLGWLRRAWPVIAAAVALAAILTLPEWARIADFADFRAFSRSGAQTLGNLPHSVSPLELFGVWPSGEYRISPSAASLPAPMFYLGALLGMVAVAIGLIRTHRERRPELASALGTAVAIYIAARIFGTPYTAAKALAIAAPIVMLVALWGVLATDWLAPIARLRPLARRGVTEHRLALTVTALGALFALAAGGSSFLVLRQAPVSPGEHTAELDRIRPYVEGGRVLFLGRDDFIAWELRGATVDTPLENFYNVGQPPSRFKLGTGEEKFDFDSVPSGVLDRYRYVLTTSSAYASEPPGNFNPVIETESYVLYKRRGPTHRRETLHERTGPGAILDCTGGDHPRPVNHGIAATATIAAVWDRPPVAGMETTWKPSATATTADPASQTLKLSPGRWQISLAYDSPRPLEIEASGPGLPDTEQPLLLPANLDFRGPSPPFPAGPLRVDHGGPVTFRVMLAQAALAGRLLGATGEAHLRTLSASPLAPVSHVAPRAACGRYVDWLRVPNR